MNFLAPGNNTAKLAARALQYGHADVGRWRAAANIVHQFPGEAAPAAREVLEMDPPACRFVWFCFVFQLGCFILL